LLKLVRLELPEGTLRELSPEQRQYCELLASRGDIPAAIINYCQYRLGEETAQDIYYTHQHNPYEVLQKPEYRPLFEDAVWWCFGQVTLDWQPTKERIAFLKKYTAGRFINVAMLQQAWALCKQYEKEDAKNNLLFGRNADEAPESPEAFDSDSMSDSELDSLRTRTLRHAQDLKRRGRGIR